MTSLNKSVNINVLTISGWMAAEAALVMSGMQKLIAWGLVLLHVVEPQRGSAEIIAIRPGRLFR